MKTMTTPPVNMQPTKRIRLTKKFKARTLHYNTDPPKSTFHPTSETDPKTGFTIYKEELLESPWQSYRDDHEFEAWQRVQETKNWRPTTNCTKLDRAWLQKVTQLPYEDTFLFQLDNASYSRFLSLDAEDQPVDHLTRYYPSPLYLHLLAMEPRHFARMSYKPLTFERTDRINRHYRTIWTCNGVDQNGPELAPDVMELCNAQQVLENEVPTYDERRRRLHRWISATEGYRLLTEHVDERSYHIPFHMMHDVHCQINTLAAVYLGDHFTNVLVEQVALGIMSSFVQQLEDFTMHPTVVARDTTYKRCYIDARFIVTLFESRRLRLLDRLDPVSPFCTPIK